ncbi:putative tail fiber [Escherichia phage Henu7]|uniref:Putative tail fiber n=1 Tax=Escherichia phage Henu7 TaxID=2589652 RepID=A0A5B8RRX6_9CAUD|nr:tail fiber protein [Escherichia phage Henu7]QEA09657.1 putative tail fiber [Escherichia phage Henu7]
MAIYRTGQASMDANGYITGYGTKWKTALTLIRPGATIVFASNPVAYATISEIVNDTSLRATSTGGAVVPRGDYVILLHDSITVDGLAQDVAETLRYYQGQETMYQEFVDFLKSFDWQKLEEIERNTKASELAAGASAKAAAQSESNANASKNAAAASATTASQQASSAASSASAAKTSENNAASSKTAAANSASSAASSATTASQHKDAAAASASAAKTSETNANASKTAAASSASAAANSASAASGSATAAKTSETNAKTSETNAKTSETNAASSKTAAEASATTATQQADRAKTEADRAASANPDNQLKKANNLSDVANKATARANLQVDRLNQDSTTETKVLSADGAQALITPNGSTWGLYRFGSGWIPLGVDQGGTGAKNAADARTNLGLGSAATKDVGANIGNVLGVGYFGFGTPGTNILASTESGFYGVDDSGTAWAPQAGSGIVCGYDPARRQQIFTGVSGNLFVRNLASAAMNTPSSTIPWTQMQPVGTSDINFKHVKGDLDVADSLENICQMEFKRFYYLDDDEQTERRGVIAQQIEQIDKEYVHSAEGVGKVTLDLNPLMMDALAAIKALRARDDENKERIAKLEGEVEELKAMVAALIAK